MFHRFRLSLKLNISLTILPVIRNSHILKIYQTMKQFGRLDLSYNIFKSVHRFMRRQLSPRNYNYTYYSTVEHNVKETKPTTVYLNSYQLPQTSTVYSIKQPSERVLGSFLEPTNYTYKNPIQHIQPITKVQTTTPIKFPYKNPGCGLSITGSTSFKTEGNKIVVKMDKITNTRKDGKTGTLRLQLVRMCYFYDGMSGLKPDQYSVVGTSNLGELEFSWSFNDIVRVMDRITDDQHKYRTCYVLLLEEYNNMKFEIVDYLNFD